MCTTTSTSVAWWRWVSFQQIGLVATLTGTLALNQSKKHRNACEQLAIVQPRLDQLEATIDKAELAQWKAEEKRWLADVVDMKKHKKLQNPYELKIDRGTAILRLRPSVLTGWQASRRRSFWPRWRRHGLVSPVIQTSWAYWMPSTKGPSCRRCGMFPSAIFTCAALMHNSEDLLDAIEEDDGSEDSQQTLETSRAEFFTRLGEWTTLFNSYIHPRLETAAQEVLEMAAPVEDDGGAHATAADADVDPPTIDDLNAVMTQVSPAPSAAGGDEQAVPAASPHIELSPAFPFRPSGVTRPDVTGRDARAALGLPPLRNGRKKNDTWQEIYATSIPLPSSFDELILARPGMASLVQWERKVREGQANDALNDLRTHLVTTEMLKIKKKDTTGKAWTTRMGKKIRRQHDQVIATADDYRRARLALIALGMTEDDVRFRPLLKQDVRAFTISSQIQQLGDSRRDVSWIWEDFSFIDSARDGQHRAFYEDGMVPALCHCNSC